MYLSWSFIQSAFYLLRSHELLVVGIIYLASVYSLHNHSFIKAYQKTCKMRTSVTSVSYVTKLSHQSLRDVHEGRWLVRCWGQSNYKRLNYLHSMPHIAEPPGSHNFYETIGENISKQNVRVYIYARKQFLFSERQM